MKNKLNFQKWTLDKAIMYPFRLKLEGYDLRSLFFTSDLRCGYAFSDTEIGFKKSYEREAAIREFKKLIK
jgi:hypothetical protein